ncbi:hypothetical protein CUZ56_01364 [Saezia sanguinis]|uniref:HTH cro/C1-type domain-containing protein n=1 Tax=Saezia sanguinis TaxID=1965230 RepID=A0A433SF71_9BURK|nr:helix-turn-helix transcriptional regulator [Saezia sanguinis]RUS67419.1 hypothetical protein CUZ56_01364 [Saezia sanguinis]
MGQNNTYKEVFRLRLKQARLSKGLSQKELGKLAGIDEFVASTRINRYEQGIHVADLETAGKLAEVLDIPLAYLYAREDDLAEVILNYHHNNIRS